MTHEELLHETQKLATEMRKMNVTSYGLKVSIHEDWCRRMERIATAVREGVKKKPPAPPVPAV